MTESRVPSMVGEKLRSIHAALSEDFPGIKRVAVALYDPKADSLRTFVHSTEGAVPLRQYGAALSEVPSLAELARTGAERVIDDLRTLQGSPARHTRCILEKGYRSSYTVPVIEDGRLCAFVFFDSLLSSYFSPRVVRQLGLYARLISLLILHSLVPVPLLVSAVRVASRLTHYRDVETGSHLDRMAAYSRLIASHMAADTGLADEYIEYLHLFAPLHDVGKIAIPDRILFKAGPLDDDELEIMRSHVDKGAEMISALAEDVGLTLMPHARMLHNIVACHHECIDGSGYPTGLRGEEIPLEARIVAVADVFDALTTVRPYKQAWTVDEAFAFLRLRAGTKLDSTAVDSLFARREAMEEIRASFADPTGGEGSHEGYPDLV